MLFSVEGCEYDPERSKALASSDSYYPCPHGSAPVSGTIATTTEYNLGLQDQLATVVLYPEVGLVMTQGEVTLCVNHEKVETFVTNDAMVHGGDRIFVYGPQAIMSITAHAIEENVDKNESAGQLSFTPE